MMKRPVRTVHVQLYGTGKQYREVKHIATIRSDWRPSDYRTLAQMFPGTVVRTARMTIPVSYLGDLYHNASFKHIESWKQV